MNYRWHSHNIGVLVLWNSLVNSTKTKENESKEEYKQLLPLLLETMEERRRVHRCHSQHMPLSLTYMNHHLT